MITKNMAGQKLGKLTVLSFDRIDEHGKAAWVCKCDCGVVKSIQGCKLRKSQKATRSCGCLVVDGLVRRSTTHGMRHSSEYVIWTDMKQRCSNVNDPYYKDYGGRGIRVCDEWAGSFVAFYEHVGPRPSKRHTLDRSDPNGDYEPGNVKWAEWNEQANNRRNNVFIIYNGKRLTAPQWDRLIECPRGAVRYRLCKGRTMGSIEKEFALPKEPIST